MIANTKVPDLTVVTASGYRYKSFLTPISPTPSKDAPVGGDEHLAMPQIQAIMRQASIVMEQHELGHVALACPPRQGVYLVFSLPGDKLCSEKDAKALVSRIVSRAYWNIGSGYEQFTQREADEIGSKTVHLTKLHVRMFGWDALRQPRALRPHRRALGPALLYHPTAPFSGKPMFGKPLFAGKSILGKPTFETN